MALLIVGIPNELRKMADETVREIDPDFIVSMTRRWKGASVHFTENKA